MIGFPALLISVNEVTRMRKNGLLEIIAAHRTVADLDELIKRDKSYQEALGPVGMVKFMQQYDMGYGDYTKEKQEQPDMSLEEIDLLLKNADDH